MVDDKDLIERLSRALQPPDTTPAQHQVERVRAQARALQATQRRSRPWTAAAAVMGLAAGLVIGTLVPLSRGVVEFDGQLLGAEGVEGSVTVRRIGIGRVIEIRTDDLPILPTTEFYEAWFVGPQDQPGSPQRISAGTFHPDAEGKSWVQLTAAVDPSQFPVLSITAEPGDGNPAATGPEVMRAALDADN